MSDTHSNHSGQSRTNKQKSYSSALGRVGSMIGSGISFAKSTGSKIQSSETVRNLENSKAGKSVSKFAMRAKDRIAAGIARSRSSFSGSDATRSPSNRSENSFVGGAQMDQMCERIIFPKCSYEPPQRELSRSGGSFEESRARGETEETLTEGSRRSNPEHFYIGEDSEGVTNARENFNGRPEVNDFNDSPPENIKIERGEPSNPLGPRLAEEIYNLTNRLEVIEEEPQQSVENYETTQNVGNCVAIVPTGYVLPSRKGNLRREELRGPAACAMRRHRSKQSFERALIENARAFPSTNIRSGDAARSDEDREVVTRRRPVRRDHRVREEGMREGRAEVVMSKVSRQTDDWRRQRLEENRSEQVEKAIKIERNRPANVPRIRIVSDETIEPGLNPAAPEFVPKSSPTAEEIRIVAQRIADQPVIPPKNWNVVWKDRLSHTDTSPRLRESENESMQTSTLRSSVMEIGGLTLTRGSMSVDDVSMQQSEVVIGLQNVDRDGTQNVEGGQEEGILSPAERFENLISNPDDIRMEDLQARANKWLDAMEAQQKSGPANSAGVAGGEVSDNRADQSGATGELLFRQPERSAAYRSVPKVVTDIWSNGGKAKAFSMDEYLARNDVMPFGQIPSSSSNSPPIINAENFVNLPKQNAPSDPIISWEIFAPPDACFAESKVVPQKRVQVVENNGVQTYFPEGESPWVPAKNPVPHPKIENVQKPNSSFASENRFQALPKIECSPKQPIITKAKQQIDLTQGNSNYLDW